MVQVNQTTKFNRICENLVMNLAHFRSWSKPIKGNQKIIFWQSARSSFLEAAFILWAKIFANQNTRQHYLNFVNEQEFKDKFYKKMNKSLHSGVLEGYAMRVQHFLQQDFTHLNNIDENQIPSLDIALESTFILHKMVFPEAVTPLDDYYKEQYIAGENEFDYLFTNK